MTSIQCIAEIVGNFDAGIWREWLDYVSLFVAADKRTYINGRKGLNLIDGLTRVASKLQRVKGRDY